MDDRKDKEATRCMEKEIQKIKRENSPNVLTYEDYYSSSFSFI